MGGETGDAIVSANAQAARALVEYLASPAR